MNLIFWVCGLFFPATVLAATAITNASAPEPVSFVSTERPQSTTRIEQRPTQDNQILLTLEEANDLKDQALQARNQTAIEEQNGGLEEDGFGKAITYPCSCADVTCSCCTGNVLQNFNIRMRQRICTNLTYDADDFTLGVKLAWNERVLYQNRISGKNPPPICLPIPRISALRVCLKFNNVYFIQRNIHACLSVETQWNKETAFAYNFDCIRLGTSGVALVKPEDGGGLPTVDAVVDAGTDDIEEYDENVSQPDKPPKPIKS